MPCPLSRRAKLATALCLRAASGARAQSGPPAPARTPAAAPARLSWAPLALRLDCLLDEPAWQRADSITDVTQRDPREGEPRDERRRDRPRRESEHRLGRRLGRARACHELGLAGRAVPSLADAAVSGERGQRGPQPQALRPPPERGGALARVAAPRGDPLPRARGHAGGPARPSAPRGRGSAPVPGFDRPARG